MMIRKMKKTWAIKIDNKIQELVRLYHKDFEATDGFAAVLWRRLTFEEIQKNRRTDKERLLTLSKEQLIDYIIKRH